jgi:steroid 5-alpha reductase family enzyme
MSFYLPLAILLFFYMNAWFLFSLLKKRNDVADTAWGLGFVLLAWISFAWGDAINWRALLVSLLVTVWGVRLAYYIHKRNKNKTEDYRYEAWRKEWGKYFFVRSYFQVFILQGIFLFLIILPVLFINKNGLGSVTIFDVLGILVWATGFYFESRGDAELARFLKNPANKGKLMQEGLWQYTRHPNYFGEVTQWWGLWIIALSISGSFFTIVGPLTITILILFVSGIPLLEKKMRTHPDFPAYAARTSMFIPWFTKK